MAAKKSRKVRITSKVTKQKRVQPDWSIPTVWWLDKEAARLYYWAAVLSKNTEIIAQALQAYAFILSVPRTNRQ